MRNHKKGGTRHELAAATTYRLSCCMICISCYLRALVERISIGFEFKTWINSFFHLLMRTLKLYTYDTIKKNKKNVTRLVPNKILDVLLSINELSMIKLVQKKKEDIWTCSKKFFTYKLCCFPWLFNKRFSNEQI